jgi:hypothetical protein
LVDQIRPIAKKEDFKAMNIHLEVSIGFGIQFIKQSRLDNLFGCHVFHEFVGTKEESWVGLSGSEEFFRLVLEVTAGFVVALAEGDH